MPRSYRQQDLKLLFALSRNQCAHPTCTTPIVEPETDADGRAIVGQIAHIVASSPDGPRVDPSFPREELNRERNLILLCPYHHAVVDAQESTYTAEQLRSWKREHIAGGRTPPPGFQWPIPRQVPPAPDGFVNRVAQLDELDRLASPDAATGPAVVVLTGSRGVGKTAISRYWADRNRARFADGELHADLGEVRHRGGVAVRDVLGDFLTAFGVPTQLIPPDLAPRSMLFRSSTAAKRLLLVLDGVENAAEVTPLIPSSPHSVVLVAGALPLPELMLDRARPLELPRLEAEDARALLMAMVGKERAEQEPEAVAALARYCDGLPVALRVCGARLQEHPRRPIAGLVERLADESSRLREMSSGTLSIQAVFNDAYGAIGPSERRLYRRLGALPLRTYSPAVAAVATDASLADAESALAVLLAHRLIEYHVERYRFHDLLRLHAAGCAEHGESAEECDAVLRRIVDYYVHAARAVDFAITPTRLRIAEAPAGEVAGVPAFASRNAAFSWFELERANLLEVVRAASAREWDVDAWRICESLWPCYFNRKPYSEWLEAYGIAVSAARRSGHPAAEARLRTGLAKALTETGEHERAEAELTTARRLAARSGNRMLEATVLEFQGHLDLARHRYRAARAAYEESGSIFAEVREARGVALQSYHLGRAIAGLGDHHAAVEAYQRAITLIDEREDELLLARTLISLAESRVEVGETRAAREAADRAVAIMRANDLPYYEARALVVLAAIGAAEGDHAGATATWRQADALFALLGTAGPHRAPAPTDAS